MKLELEVPDAFADELPEGEDRNAYFAGLIRAALSIKARQEDVFGLDADSGAAPLAALGSDFLKQLEAQSPQTIRYLVVEVDAAVNLQSSRDYNEGVDRPPPDILRRYVEWLRAEYPGCPVYRLWSKVFAIKLGGAATQRPRWVDAALPLRHTLLEIEGMYPFRNLDYGLTPWLLAASGDASYEGRTITHRLVPRSHELSKGQQQLGAAIRAEQLRADELDSTEQAPR